MRYWISGIIGVLWGGSTIVGWILRGMPQGAGSASYQAGHWTGLLIGFLLFVAGIYYIRKAIITGKATAGSDAGN